MENIKLYELLSPQDVAMAKQADIRNVRLKDLTLEEVYQLSKIIQSPLSEFSSACCATVAFLFFKSENNEKTS